MCIPGIFCLYNTFIYMLNEVNYPNHTHLTLEPAVNEGSAKCKAWNIHVTRHTPEDRTPEVMMNIKAMGTNGQRVHVPNTRMVTTVGLTVTPTRTDTIIAWILLLDQFNNNQRAIWLTIAILCHQHRLGFHDLILQRVDKRIIGLITSNRADRMSPR